MAREIPNVRFGSLAVVEDELDEPLRQPLLFGGELVLRDGQSAGEVTSAAYGHTLGASVALGWVGNADGVDRAYVEAGTYELDVGGERFAATAHLRSPYDPKGARIRA